MASELNKQHGEIITRAYLRILAGITVKGDLVGGQKEDYENLTSDISKLITEAKAQAVRECIWFLNSLKETYVMLLSDPMLAERNKKGFRDSLFGLETAIEKLSALGGKDKL